MKLEKVVPQLYTVRDFLKTPADIAASMKKIAKIGYKTLQLSGLGPIDEAELVKITKGEGLDICSTHEDGKMILENTAAVVEKLNKLGCKLTAVPYPPGKLDSLKDVEALAAKINKAGEVMAKAGMVLTYHNHAIEFRRFEGKLMLDIIYDNTDKKFVQGEIDTYWVQAGGGDPVKWVKKMKGRLPMVHLKDYMVEPGGKPAFAEIGYGNLDMDAIISASADSGCEWYVVEQDTCPGDPFDSLAKSFNFIKEKYVR